MSWATGLMVYSGDLVDRPVRGPAAGRAPGRESRAGARSGARPSGPQLLRKAIITSLVAAVLWIAFYFLHQSDIFSFRQMAD